MMRANLIIGPVILITGATLIGLAVWHAAAFDPSGELMASPGEQVTREDGTVICTITTPLFTKSIIQAEGWCKDWTVEPPKDGSALPDDPVGRRWIAFIDHSVKLHVGNEWRG